MKPTIKLHVDKVHNYIIGIRNSTQFNGRAQLFLMGKNRNNVVDTLVSANFVEDSENPEIVGCSCTPGTGGKSIAQAIIDLDRKRRQFAGFLRLCYVGNEDHHLWGWRDHSSGETPAQYPEVLFVSYHSEGINTAMYHERLNNKTGCTHDNRWSISDDCHCDGILYDEHTLVLV